MLPKLERLRSERGIRHALNAPEFDRRTPLLHLVGRRNDLGFSRLVVITPKKLGKAVQRNRLKRVTVEAFKKARAGARSGLDLAIFPRRRVISAGFEAIVNDIDLALKQINA